MSVALAMETSATAMDSRVFLDRSRDALQQLAVLLRNSYLHDLGNQVFEEPLEKLTKVLGRLLQGEGRFRLERGGEELFANGVRLRMEIRTLHQPKVRSVTDQTQRTVAALLADLSHPDHKGWAIRRSVDPEKYGINSSHYVL